MLRYEPLARNQSCHIRTNVNGNSPTDIYRVYIHRFILVQHILELFFLAYWAFTLKALLIFVNFDPPGQFPKPFGLKTALIR